MEVSKKKKIMEYNEESENSINDSDEYNNIEGENILLKNKKKQIKKDIKNFDEMKKELEKYKGKNISYNDLQNSDSEEDNEEEDSKEEEEENNEEEEENMEENEDDDNYNEKENIEKEEDDNNMKPNILNDDDNKEKESEESVDEEKEMTLQEKMEKQDEQYLKTLSKVTKDEIRKAKNIINQKELYETFVGIRIALQNLLSDINSLPTSKNFSKFLELSSKETQDLYQKLKLNVNSTFYDTIIFHKEFLKKQNYPKSEQFNPVLELEKLLKKKEDFNEMDEQLNKIHNNLFKIDQKIMNIWYRKTVVNQFQTNNKIIKKLSNNDNFCEHVLSSVENNMNTLLKKTQKYNNANDNNIQLLGRKRLSAEEYEYDKEIFNDNDFYNFLLKEFLLNNEKEIDENNYVEKRDENGLVEGRYDLTMRYILNRNTKIKKNVDTKATKNRKIRYDKHEEIINFMVPENNDKEISGRNIIINSLFGTKKMNIDVDNKENEEKRENEKIEENDIDLI
jgi:protein AATF/BFR2